MANTPSRRIRIAHRKARLRLRKLSAILCERLETTALPAETAALLPILEDAFRSVRDLVVTIEAVTKR